MNMRRRLRYSRPYFIVYKYIIFVIFFLSCHSRILSDANWLNSGPKMDVVVSSSTLLRINVKYLGKSWIFLLYNHRRHILPKDDISFQLQNSDVVIKGPTNYLFCILYKKILFIDLYPSKNKIRLNLILFVRWADIWQKIMLLFEMIPF